jgi:endoglucanase
VLFELLNEPNHALTPALWNSFFPGAGPGARVEPAADGHHRLGVELDREAGGIVLPEGARDIVVTVHYYDPHTFTHQGAAFEGRANDVGYEWNATEAERGAIERDFLTAQQWALQHKRPVFLGEFGAYEAADMGSRALTIRGTNGRVARLELGLLEFDDDFIVYDTDAGKWVD